jgi:hypothetical protein
MNPGNKNSILQQIKAASSGGLPITVFGSGRQSKSWVLEEGFFFALTAAPASPIHRPPCNFYDPSASSDDFLPNALARIRTTMETVTITENFTCASGTIIEYPLSKMR